MSLVDVGVAAGLVVLTAAFLTAFFRVVAGPGLADRAMAADVCLVAVVGAVALLGLRTGSTAFLDAVVVASLLHYVSGIALARLIEPEERE